MWIWRKIKKNFCKIDMNIWNVVNYIVFYMNDVSWKKGLKTRGKIRVSNDEGIIKIGENACLNSAKWANSVGHGDSIWIQIMKNAQLIIGNNVGMSNVQITCVNRIYIGNNVMIGAGTQIYDTDFHSINPSQRWELNYAKQGPIIIEDNVFIGADVIILKGVSVGKGSVIGAGSVVTKSIPAGQIWGGNPACFLKNVN